MPLPISESMYAQILGWEFLNYLKEAESKLPQHIREIDSKAVKILEEIRTILDDDTIDDPECFERIDRIVSVYNRNDIGTDRHDWG